MSIVTQYLDNLKLILKKTSIILALDSIRIAIFFFGNIFRIEKIILVLLVYNKKDILNYLLAYLQLYEKFYYWNFVLLSLLNNRFITYMIDKFLN